jgi:hypothetical protein
MGTRGDHHQPDHTDDDTTTPAAVCSECGHSDSTVRDLGLKIPYDLCDPCFDDLVAIRTAAGPLPLSRILDDALTGTDPLQAGRRSDTWRRTTPQPDEPAADEREDRTA